MQAKVIRHEGMLLRYAPVGESYGIQQFAPGENAGGAVGEVALPPFDLAVAGDNYGLHAGVLAGGSAIPVQCRCTAAQFTEAGAELVYQHDDTGLQVQVQLQFIPGARVIRQINRVTNGGTAPLTLTHISSMRVQGIATDGLLPWYDARKVRLHYCHSAWTGEGQWRSGSLEDLGVYPASVHQCASSFQVRSIGSWSTGRFAPTAVIEDRETGQVWYFEIEHSAGWHYEVGVRKAADGDGGNLYMLAGCADEAQLGWYKTLAPGESYTTAPVAFGCTYGGFEEAIRQLTAYRRSCRKPENAWEGECPLVFNDYMNALWGNPTIERLRPLIDAAATAGAEAFCIDAGWFGPRANGWGCGIGDWEPSADRFGPAGLQGIVDYIRQKGMIPGLWLELETCQKLAKAYEKPDNWFLTRHGKRLGGERALFDFRNPDVRAHLHRCIDRLVEMGVGYFKNDYNQSTCVGDDKAGAAAQGTVENAAAFYDFIDEVRRRHPRLILENCGSGGLRQDYGIMSHFHLQSTSDQEDYYRYPAVLIGTLANLLPEQAGAWAYPYPYLFPDMAVSADIPDVAAFRQKFVSGEETIFNMVNGMCGNMYLSGHIDCADDHNMALIQEGAAVYKRERGFIRQACPVWPTGMQRMNDRGWASLGLLSADGGRMLLAVWRLAQGGDWCEIPLGKWAQPGAVVRQIYPAAALGTRFVYNPGSRTLGVQLPQPLCARLFEVTLR